VAAARERYPSWIAACEARVERDQQFTAGRVVEFGAGICLPVEASPAEIASALVELLGQPRFGAAADTAAAIQADWPDEAAIEALLAFALAR
jgi:UDP:flavonoid glycosyltransferase YjiC (YdhE family)